MIIVLTASAHTSSFFVSSGCVIRNLLSLMSVPLMNASRTLLALSNALSSATTAVRPTAAALAKTFEYASKAKRWWCVRES